MIRSLGKWLLRRYGYRICRIDTDDDPINPQIDYQDWEKSLATIEEVTNRNDSSMTWQRSKRYLDLRRVNFYYSVVQVLDDAGVLQPGIRVLDVGVYFGYLLRIMHKRQPNASYFGTETHEIRLHVAKELCPFARITCSTISELHSKDPYQLVVLTEVLEHLEDPVDAIHSLMGLTDTLFLTVPNGRRDTTEAMQHNPKWQSYRGHINFWSPESWELWLKRALPSYRVDTGQLPTDKLYALVQSG